MKVAFVIPYEPMGKERPRAYSFGGHTQVYTPSKTREYEEMIKTIYSLQVGHKRFPDDVFVPDIFGYYRLFPRPQKYQQGRAENDA